MKLSSMARDALCSLWIANSCRQKLSPNSFPILMFVYKKFTSFVKMITSILYYIICFTFMFCSFYNILEIIIYIQITCLKVITAVPVQYFQLIIVLHLYCIEITIKLKYGKLQVSVSFNRCFFF